MILLILLATTYAPWAQADNRTVTSVYFQPVPLGENDRIAIVEADLTCGHFSDFRHLPEDWSVQLIRPIDGVEKLKMEAGHGSSQLLNIRELNGVLGITKNSEKDCFLLSFAATITIDAEKRKTVPIRAVLKPWASNERVKRIGHKAASR